MGIETERTICLVIDDPEQNTLTTFSKVLHSEKPNRQRNTHLESTELMSADIYMPADKARGVLDHIESQWEKGDDALFLQHVGGGQQQALILGYSVINEGSGQNLTHFRIYTAR